ncbi:hypothetical protein R1sor_008771 [Riccia sorocarpa]|uniref:Oligosaccharyltransferase complex subunit n=1 Tax=Riccia sorocarpa TaxID=122646 RepID=A0ABD3HYD1_9MARC
MANLLFMRLQSFSLPSASVVFALVLVSYFLVISGFVYDVIVEPPGIGSRQDPYTGAIRPVVFLPGRVNGQYIVEGLSSGFMFVLGGIGIVMLDLASEKARPRSVRMSFVAAGVALVLVRCVQAGPYLPREEQHSFVLGFRMF